MTPRLIPEIMNLAQLIALQISDIFSLSTLKIDTFFVPENAKPYVVIIKKKPINEVAKEIIPFFSGPKNLDKYGKVIKLTILLKPWSIDRDIWSNILC